MSRLPDETQNLKDEYGLKELLLKRSGVDAHRAVFNPTCNIAGLWSGYQGPGSKTVLPARAFAKIDFRLVPEQDPEDILRKLRRHLEKHGFGDIEVTQLGGGVKPATVDPDEELVRLCVETAEEVYRKPPRLEPIVGGTTPMYLFTEQMAVVNPGLGYDGTRAHSPNENIRLQDFENAVKHISLLLERFSAA